MTAVDIIADAALSMGYRAEAVIRDYTFSDVLDSTNATRTVPLAAFAQTPPSYRSSAIGAVIAESIDAQEVVRSHRALGAPLLFVIEGNDVSVWQVRGTAPARLLDRTAIDRVPELFERNRNEWQPDAIHRAKSIGAVDQAYQLDFVDIGLLPAVEGEIHVKIGQLLVDMLKAVESQHGRAVEPKVLFHVVFRMLAVKVLRDRGHPYAREWDANDLGSLIHAIESYYSLSSVPAADMENMQDAFTAAWECLCDGISFANISSEDLAFVYENTLVTPKARKHFGTHSTPHQLAEYAVTRLELHRHEPDNLYVYEPFAGAAPFLVSALRHMREALPADWNDRERHELLVKHLEGDEVDTFACEVATLSLILADYPNHNGWQIEERDLFEGTALRSRLNTKNIILCNPPFQDFSRDERSRYPIAAKFYSKPVAVLNTALDRHPLAFAIVLPRAFILEGEFAHERQRIEELYGDIELVALPDSIFGASSIESALLIAREPRKVQASGVVLRSTEVSSHDGIDFLKSGRTTTQRHLTRTIGESPSGVLWIPPAKPVWDYLSGSPRFGDHFSIRWGIQWQAGRQKEAWSRQRQTGYRLGLHAARRSKQFMLPEPVWLDCRREKLRGYAIDRPWDRPKLVTNAARLSRGPWCIAASLDSMGLVCSQQFFGLWPRETLTGVQLLAFAALLNGPVANAYLAIHSEKDRFRISTVNQIPVPGILPLHAGELAAEYLRLVSDRETPDARAEDADMLLTRIDAAVLDAYDLPLRVERQLLDYFLDRERPTAHPWRHWKDSALVPGLTLAERMFSRLEPRGGWFHDVFRPLPTDAAQFLREYGA